MTNHDKNKNIQTMYASIFEMSSEGILIADDQGCYVDANPAACSLLGMRRENIMGRFVENFADPKRQEETRKGYKRFLEQGYQEGFFRIYRPDGSTRHVSYVSQAHVVPGLSVTLLRDITERDQAERQLRDNEDELRRALVEAQQAARAKSQFVANISHEIRTPIHGILGTAELLQQTALSPEQQEYVHMMSDSGKALLALVSDVLDFSRGEAGKLRLNNKNFDLPSLIDLVFAIYLERAKEKKITLRQKMQPGMSRLRFGDPVRVQQVLTNLIDNAIKFTTRGSITLHISQAGAGRKASFMKFAVKDTGPGISRKDQRNLFKPFSQADSSSARSHGGTGLGLAISKQLVELMGGTIGMKSAARKGATFSFVIPLRKSLEHVTAVETPIVPANGRGARVARTARLLIVEDNHINQVVLVRQLHRLGYRRIDTAENGLDAIKALDNNTYNLIFMDCQMPKMDGYQTTTKIRSHRQNDRIPIIAMTAHALEEDREKCLAAGMNDYVSKPVSLSMLRDVLTKWLRSRKKGAIEPPSEARHGPVDLKQLSQVAAIHQNEKDPLIAQYFNDTAECLNQLHAFLKNGERENIRAVAHGALGASRMLGMTAVAEVLERLEILGARGELGQAEESLQQAREELSRARDYLRDLQS